MAFFMLPMVFAFVAPPISSRIEGGPPERSGIPLAFAVFCITCAALSLAEAVWPQLAAGMSAIDAFIMPRL